MKLLQLKSITVIAAALLCFFGAQLARCQEASADTQRIPGTLNADTGKFSPAGAVRPVPETSATMFTAGTIELSITINLVTELPQQTQILCGMNLNVLAQNLTDGASANWLEVTNAFATIHGHTAYCTLTIPYYWMLPTSATNEVKTLNGLFTVTATTFTGFTSSVARSTNQPFLSTTIIPPNYTVSKYHASATL